MAAWLCDESKAPEMNKKERVGLGLLFFSSHDLMTFVLYPFR